MKFTLYDVKCAIPNYTWSLNTAKAHFSLRYKKIKYETIFLSYPEIEPTLQPLGFGPHQSKLEKIIYTVPALLVETDDGIKTLLNDSNDIAKWLDTQYPSNPLFALEAVPFFERIQEDMPYKDIYGIIAVKIASILDPEGKVFYESTRALPNQEPSLMEERWSKALPYFIALADMLEVHPGPFFWGYVPYYVDFVVGGIFVWYKAGSETDFERVMDAKPGSVKLRELWDALDAFLPPSNRTRKDM